MSLVMKLKKKWESIISMSWAMSLTKKFAFTGNSLSVCQYKGNKGNTWFQQPFRFSFCLSTYATYIFLKHKNSEKEIKPNQYWQFTWRENPRILVSFLSLILSFTSLFRPKKPCFKKHGYNKGFSNHQPLTSASHFSIQTADLRTSSLCLWCLQTSVERFLSSHDHHSWKGKVNKAF